MSAAEPMAPGTLVRCWSSPASRAAGHSGVVGVYLGPKENGEEHNVRPSPGALLVVARVFLPLNSPELRAEEEARRREAWLAERPARRAAFIEYETGRAIESGIRQAEMGLRFRYGFKCSRCSHVSRDPADTWDHAIQCRGAEPTRAALRANPNGKAAH